jgi:hypothetical protein
MTVATRGRSGQMNERARSFDFGLRPSLRMTEGQESAMVTSTADHRRYNLRDRKNSTLSRSATQLASMMS